MSNYEKISVIFIILTFLSFVIVSIVTFILTTKSGKENEKLLTKINEKNTAVLMHNHRFECYKNITNIQVILGYSIIPEKQYGKFLQALMYTLKDIRVNLATAMNSAPLLFTITNEEYNKFTEAINTLNNMEKLIGNNMDSFYDIDKVVNKVNSFEEAKQKIELLKNINKFDTLIKLEVKLVAEIEEIRVLIYTKLYHENSKISNENNA